MSRVTRLTGYALALCLLPTAILRAQLIEEVFAPNPGDLYSSYVELGGIGGDMPETGQTYLFTPLWQTESELFFADLRGLYNDQGATEGNWGLGYRKMITPDTIFGVYGYYDQRNTQFDNTFRQGTLGMEILRVQNEARWNVYIPEADQDEAAPVAFLAGGNINVAQGFEAAYYGTDFEYGHLLRDTPNGDREVRGYVGGYVFDRGEDQYKSIIGPRVRVEGRMFDLPALGNGSRVVAGAQYQYDDARGSQGIAYAGIRLAFGGRKLDRLHRRMMNPVVRDVDIVVNEGGRGQAEIAKIALTGEMPSDVVFINGDTIDPETVFANAGPDSLVIFNGEISTDPGFVFNNGQTAIGGGGILPVIGCETGLMANFIAPGGRPTITGTNIMNDVFTLADMNVVSGLNIEGGGNGLYGPGGGTFLFRDISVTGADDSGAFFDGSVTADIIDSQFNGNDNSGLAVVNNLNGNLINNRFNNNANDGAAIGGDINGDLIGNQFNGNQSDGLDDVDNIFGNVVNNQFNGNGSGGLYMTDNLTGNVTGNTFNGNTRADGLRIGGALIGNLNNNTTNGNGDGKNDHGFEIRNGVMGSITNNTANDNEGDGIHIVGDVSGDISGNTTNNNDPGIYVEGNVGGNVSNNTANNNANQGIFIDGTVFGDVVNNETNDNGSDGLVIGLLQGGDIRNNTALRNDSSGILLLTAKHSGNITNNIANDNTFGGITLGSNPFGATTFSGSITGNTTNGNLLGIQTISLFGTDFISGNVSGNVSGNTANQNTIAGIAISGTVGGDIFDNTTNDNDGNGFHLVGNILMGTVFEDNTANGNGADGFNFGDNNGTFSNNRASFNTGMGYNGGANNGTATNNTGSGNTGGGNTYP